MKRVEQGRCSRVLARDSSKGMVELLSRTKARKLAALAYCGPFLLLSACGSDGVSVTGSVTVMGHMYDDGCHGERTYWFDVTESAPVVILVDGQEGGLGRLGSGEPGTGTSSDGKPTDTCIFEFQVPDVAEDGSVYQVRVAGRDGPEYSRAEIADEVRLSIGLRAE